MLMEHKVVPVTGFKVVDDAAGIVEAFVSVTGAVDSVRDRIVPGAYEKTLVTRTPKGVWSHNWDQPVSKTLSAEEVFPGDSRLPAKTRSGEDWPTGAGALLVKTQFNVGDGDNPGTQRARDAYSDVKFYGADQEWSIGYNVPPGASRVDGKTGVRELTHVELFEYSPVLFGAMSLTATAGVKEAQQAWRAALEAGTAKEGQVATVEREEAAAVLGAGLSPGEKDGEEAVTEDQPVAEGIPVTTPADVIHQAAPGHTGDGAGVALEQRPEEELPATGPTERPKAAEFTVRLSAAGKGAIDEAKGWYAAEAQKDDCDGLALLDEFTRRVTAITEDPANVEVQSVDILDGKAMVTLTGSFEERVQACQRSLRDALSDVGEELDLDLDDRDDWGYPRWYVTTEATFNNRVVAVAYDLNGDSQPRYFEASYAFDGQQAALRNLREVRIEATVAAKGEERLESMRLSVALFRKAAGREVPTPAPLDQVPVTSEAKDGEPEEGEFTVVTLSEADLLLLERLKLAV